MHCQDRDRPWHFATPLPQQGQGKVGGRGSERLRAFPTPDPFGPRTTNGHRRLARTHLAAVSLVIRRLAEYVQTPGSGSGLTEVAQDRRPDDIHGILWGRPLSCPPQGNILRRMILRVMPAQVFLLSHLRGRPSGSFSLVHEVASGRRGEVRHFLA
jgi:hypothetical protein